MFKKILACAALSVLSLSSLASNRVSVEAVAGELIEPKINLVVVTRTSNDNQNWSDPVISNGGAFDEWTCTSDQAFGGDRVYGIADFEDGFFRNAYKEAMNQGIIPAGLLPADLTDAQIRNYIGAARNCLAVNIEAGNVQGNLCGGNPLDLILNPLRNGDYTEFANMTTKVAGCLLEGVDLSNPSLPASGEQKPVYSYQYKYVYNFPAAERTDESERFRSLTGLEGDYDGVVYSYTYYTYENCQNTENGCGIFTDWYNPVESNDWSGWLVHGIYSGQ